MVACAPAADKVDGTDSTWVGTQLEECGNGVDDDGDGLTDCEDTDCDGTCAEDCADGRDNDGDGLVDCDDGDCNDPACVEDCADGRDNDGDRVIDCSDPDCNDPVCDELCSDGRDNDADGAVDCDDPDCDGFCGEVCDDGRDNDGNGLVDCMDPACTDFCDEICDNGVDDDTDGLIDCLDPECDPFCDVDGDGFVSDLLGGDDCDDLNAAVNPDGDEVCDGFDNDCDGLVDLADPSLDGSTLSRFYGDADLDGFGDRNVVSAWLCLPPDGYVDNDDDCDDDDATVYLGAVEVCDGQDNDCDGLVDAEDPDVDLSTATTWYIDADGDGFGSPAASIVSCTPPNGYVDNDEDCDDDDPLVLAPADFWEDVDGDGYGAGPTLGVVDCTSPADGWVSVLLGEDCVPDDPSIHPSAPEVCGDGIDQDCDGVDVICCETADPACAAVLWEERCYVFCGTSLSWEDALDDCAADGAHLVSLEDHDEEAFTEATIDLLAPVLGGAGASWWTGFNDRAVEGVWEWEDGAPVTWINWYPGEPNDAGGEDCGTVNRFSPDLGWNDEKCSNHNPYVCKR
jgi:hypothetical protein